MIPKIIHYCWFGENKKDEQMQKCIDSWKKHMPDYEIKEWSDKDLPLLRNNRYVQEAYESKKYAFVADVFRLYALATEGGVYLDTDVEVKKSFTPLLDYHFFIGSEQYKKSKHLGTAVIGSVKGHPLIKKMLSVYDDLSFILPNGKLDQTPNTERLPVVLKEAGFKETYTEAEPIHLGAKNVILPIGILSKETPESYAVHHFAASWVDPFNIKEKLSLRLGENRFHLFKVNRKKANVPFEMPNADVVCSGKQAGRSFWLIARSKINSR